MTLYLTKSFIVLMLGASDGDRTHDLRNHNPTL